MDSHIHTRILTLNLLIILQICCYYISTGFSEINTLFYIALSTQELKWWIIGTKLLTLFNGPIHIMCVRSDNYKYYQTSGISCIKSQHLNVSHLTKQFSLCNLQGCIQVSDFKGEIPLNICEKGSSVHWKGGIQYKCYIKFCEIWGDLPPLFPKLGGQVVNLGEIPPSLALDTTLNLLWRCSWISADRWCSNYIWVINNFIAN